MTDVDAFRQAVTGALAPVPPGFADGRTLWQALGHAGVPGELFGPDLRLDRVDALLSTLDERFGVGAVLSVCVQVATALPILREAASTDPAAKALDAAMRGEAMLALAHRRSRDDVGSLR